MPQHSHSTFGLFTNQLELSTRTDLSLQISPGTVPLRWLFWRFKLSREVRFHKDSGILPEKLLSDIWNWLSSMKFSKIGGNVPVNLLRWTRNLSRDWRLPNRSEMGPLNSLSQRKRVLSDLIFPISGGMRPVRLFLATSTRGLNDERKKRMFELSSQMHWILI